MKTTFLGAASVLLMGFVACGGDKESAPLVLNDTAADGGARPAPAAPAADKAGTATTTDATAPRPDGGAIAKDGNDSRMAVGQHCCVNGQYFLCPDANACFETDKGGDLGDPDQLAKCIQACNGEGQDCFTDCLKGTKNGENQSGGPPPRCIANVPPPPGVDCAAGKMNVKSN